MRKWISFPHKEGKVSRQAHADFPEEAIYEREIGRSGFFGPTAHVHHQRPPTSWESWEGPLKPRAFDFSKTQWQANSPWESPIVLSNTACKIRLWQVNENMPYLVRNADGDDLLFIHDGEADLFCDYGHMRVKEGDYIVIPRSTMWRLEVIKPVSLMMIEATNDSYQLPEKGLVGPQAIFDPAMLDVPAINDAFKAQQTDDTWQVLIKRREQISIVTYGYSPLDAVGWHGDLSVVRINWRDIRPLMSHRYHLPPSAHTTFVASRFVVCTFVPRPIESDPGALKVPFYHNNDDFDEVIFYHAGDFFSRDNIGPAMMTFHPCGFTHGPHPKAFAAGQKHTRKETDEVAVMIDTRDPLDVSEFSQQVELQNYSESWKTSDV
ncbi:MAG: homogentisate 1,2-dioxygenase [Pseudomonadota bacterium]